MKKRNKQSLSKVHRESTAAQKAVIYARVSSAKQKTEGHGLDSQETRCREFAGYKGYTVVEVFRDDISGKYTGRPGMLAMLAFLKKHRNEPHVVIIDDISRLARGLDAHLELRAALIKAGGILQSPSIEFGEDSDSLLVENLLASVSQHQRQKNGEQTKNRMRARAMAGYHCFHAPIGYRFETVKGHGKMLVRDEPIASVLQEALEGYASGRLGSLSETMRFLQSHPLYPHKRRETLSVERVIELKTRVLYAGYIDMPEWGIHMLQAKHEPLISLETFKAVQERMNAGSYVPARKDLNADFPLRQFICCGSCGHPLAGCWSKGRSKSHPYYLCQQKGCADYGKSLRRDDVEREFEVLLTELRPSRALFDMADAMFRDLWKGRMASASEQAKLIADGITKLDKSIGQFLDRIGEAGSSTVIEAYERRIHALEEEKALLREKAAQCGRALPDYDQTFRTALNFLANPSKLWVSERLEDKRTVLKLVFSDRLAYKRGEGFRTAVTSSPFTLLSSLKGGQEGMVPPVGLEPTLP